MNRKILIVGMLLLSTTVSHIAAADILSDAKNMMGDDALLGSLASSLDMDAEQAGGGIGSILSLAQNKLPAADYESIAASLPGADKYLKMAKDAGVLTDPITDVGRLNSAMEKLGISSEASSALYSKLGDLVGTTAGGDLKDSLMGLLQ